MANLMEMETALGSFKDIVKKLYEQSRVSASEEDLRRLVADGLVHLVNARQANNCLSLETERLREQTNEHRAELDERNLSLQNLLYEKLYYEKEIAACRSYKSAYSDEQIGLMPLEDFLATAPPGFKEGCEGDEHKTMNQRLAHELYLRKEMLQRLESLAADKQKLTDELNSQRQKVDGLRQHLSSVADASKPLQDALAPALAPKQLNSIAELLPVPLYIIFSQIANYRDLQATEIYVTVSGSEEEAEMFKQAFITYERQQPQDAASGVGSTKHSKSGNTEEGSIMAVPTVHPLTVQLQLQLNGALTTIGFQHVHPLNVVFAGSDDPATTALLAGVFPGDTGAVDLFGGAPPQGLGADWRPYRWAQQLAGLDVVPSLPLWATLTGEQQAATLNGLALYRGQLRVQTLLEALRSAQEAAAALKQILKTLAGRRFPMVQTPGKPAVAVFLHWQQLPQSTKGAAPKLVPSKPPTPAPSPPRTSRAPSPAANAPAAAQEDDEEEEEGVIQEDGELQKAPTPLPQALTPPADPPSAPLSPEAAAFMDIDDPSTTALQLDALPSPNPEATATPLQQILEGPLPLSPASAKFRIVMRCTPVELEAHVSVFPEYPLRPPRLKVVSVRRVETEKRGATTYIVKSTVITSGFVNDVDFIERQCNLGVLEHIPEDKRLETLSYQLHALRHAVDDLANLLRMEGQYVDPLRKLQTRQRLVGRARVGILTPPL